MQNSHGWWYGQSRVGKIRDEERRKGIEEDAKRVGLNRNSAHFTE
jgi:hypothetical protein